MNDEGEMEALTNSEWSAIGRCIHYVHGELDTVNSL